MKQITVVNQDYEIDFPYEDIGNGVILQEFEGFEYPLVRDVIEDVAGWGGSKYVTSSFGPRRMAWAGELFGNPDTIFALRRNILAPLTQDGRLKLIKFTTYDDLELQCEAEIVKVLMPYTHMVHKYLIEAKAPDWRFYSQELYELASADFSQLIQNAGTDRTPPAFRIDGPFTSATVTNLSNSQSFTIEEDIEDGEYVDIDVVNNEILQDGETPIFSSFSGDFLNMLPGDNTLNFTYEDGGANTLLTTTWRDAYLGL